MKQFLKMKLISTTLLLGAVFADINTIINILTEDELYSQINGLQHHFSVFFSRDEGLPEEYGCWCHFKDKMAIGFGDPIDELDQICRDLQRGYDCLRYDYLDKMEIDGISPHEVSYVAIESPMVSESVIADWVIFDITFKCAAANPGNQLGTDACATENYFAYRLLKAFLKEIQYKPDFFYYTDTGLTPEFCSFAPASVNQFNGHNIVYGETQTCSGSFPERYSNFTVMPPMPGSLLDSQKKMVHKDQCVSFSDDGEITIEPCESAKPWSYSESNSIKNSNDECIRIKKNSAFKKFKLLSYGVGLAPCKTGNLIQSFIWCPESGHLKVFSDQRYCLRSDDNDNLFVGPCDNVSIENFEIYAIFGTPYDKLAAY